MKSKRLEMLLLTLGILLVAVGNALAQVPVPSPEGQPSTTSNDYTINSSLEAGVRGISINGNENKFNSDLNYRPGFRFFDSSFLMQTKDGRGKPFDTFLMTSSGWSADPTGYTRLKVEKTGVYRFDASLRRINFFNNLNNHADNLHTSNLVNRFGDFDLTLLPQNEDIKFRLGYSFERKTGPAFTTYRIQNDEFPIFSDVESRANDFRGGIDWKLLGFKFSLTHGYRYFKDETDFSIFTQQQGANPAGARLDTFQRQLPVKGNSHFTNVSINRLFAKRIDFTGRFIYSTTSTKFRLAEDLTGRDAQNNRIISDRFDSRGAAKRPYRRGNTGVTFLITDKFRVSETFDFEAYSIGGENVLTEVLTRRNAVGAALPTSLTNTLVRRFTGYRRFANLIEADYQFSTRFALHAGYRYADRSVTLDDFDRNLAQPRAVDPLPERFDNRTNTLIAGFKLKPKLNWTIYFDMERGEADKVFTRLDNYKFTNYRARSRLTFNQVALNLSAITKDNNNPTGTLDTPPQDFGADINNRLYSGTVDWTPLPQLSFNTGYTYQHITSQVAIIAPVNNVLLQGISRYFVRDHYAFLDVYAQPHRRVSLYASYRISNDRGQGDRVAPATQFIFGSYPLQFQSPEARLAIKLNRYVDWNVGYQFYDYRERFQRLQDYRAHLPYVSLRFNFSRGER